MRLLTPVLLLTLVLKTVQDGGCPYDCLCDFESMTADCSDRFMRFPPENVSTAINTLLLQNNHLGDLTDRYFSRCQLTHLTGLDVSSNRVTAIHRNAFHGMGLLASLTLRNNQISFLEHEAFAGLGSLGLLNLNGNWLGTLYVGFFRPLGKLRTLILKNNRLEYIEPDSFQGPGSLAFLDLSGNRLRTLRPGVLQGLGASLEVLAVNNNSLETIEPGAFRNMSRLFFLSLGGNAIEDLSSARLQGLSGLEYLYLYDNRIEIVGWDDLKPLLSLRFLDLTRNQIFHVSPEAFARNSRLEELKLSHNKGLCLPRIRSSSLQTLKLSGCPLRQVSPEQFRATPHLRTLSLDGTRLSGITTAVLRHLTQLRFLALHDNPLACTCALREVREWCRERGVNTSLVTEDVGLTTFQENYEPSCYFPEQDVVMNWELINCSRN